MGLELLGLGLALPTLSSDQEYTRFSSAKVLTEALPALRLPPATWVGLGLG